MCTDQLEKMFHGQKDEDGKDLPKASDVLVDFWTEDWSNNPHV